MTQTKHNDLRSTVMLPNGHKPISDWKPSDGYIRATHGHSSKLRRLGAALLILGAVALLVIVGKA